MNRGGFSWKRATGISAAKSRISRKIGIPLTRSGRQRKLGAALGGCMMKLAGLLFITTFLIVSIVLFIVKHG
jgi:hypothetical protein